MASMDIFSGDAFNTVSLTRAFERVPHRPTMLRSMPGLIDAAPIRTKTFSIEERNGKLRIIQSSERGAPIKRRDNEKRNIRDFRTTRIAEGDTIMADEIQGIRAFGSETELMQVMEEVMRRYDGPTGIQRDVELTEEHMALGMIQGVVYDADGSVIYDWFDEWGILQAAEINFSLATATTKVRTKCHQVIRAMQKAAKGSWILGSTQVHALAGDDFFDGLVDHDEVQKTYQNWQAAQELRGPLAFDAFYFGGIYWHNFRGTDDYDKTATQGTARVGVDPDKAKFFPVNAPGTFQHVMAPAEFLPFVNTPGKDVYGMIIPDEKRQAYVEVEAYAYPLFICTNPGMLQRARRA